LFFDTSIGIPGSREAKPNFLSPENQFRQGFLLAVFFLEIFPEPLADKQLFRITLNEYKRNDDE